MAYSAGDALDFAIYGSHLRVTFPIRDAAGALVTGATGLDSEVSIDQGTFVDCINEAIEIGTSSGKYYLDLDYTEMTAKTVAVQIKSTSPGALTTDFIINPRRLISFEGSACSGAGTANTITLGVGSADLTDFYKGMWVRVSTNTPAGAIGQTRKIISYNNTTKVATVESNWGTNPSGSSNYEILVESWAEAQLMQQIFTDVNFRSKVGFAVWRDNTTAGDFGVASTIGKLLVDNIDAAISSRLATAGYTAPPAVSAIATGIWQDTTSSPDFTAIGSIGLLLKTNVDALISSRLSTAGYTAPPNVASIVAGVWVEPTANFVNIGSVGKLIADNLNATISSRAPASTALDNTVWTSAKAAFVDVAISSRLATAGYTAPPNTSLISTAVWDELTSNSRLGGSIGQLLITNIDVPISSRMATFTYSASPTTASIATAVWTDLLSTSDFSTIGSIGFTLKNNIDANIASRSTYAGADTSGTTTLLSRLTSGRANNLDFLDVAISSRMATFTYTTPPTVAAVVTGVWTDLLAGADFSTAASIGKLLKDDIDAAISSRSVYAGADTSGTTTLLTRLTSGRATLLDNLDAAVSTRAASATALSNVQWTNARAGYLDNLNIGGPVAASSEVTAIQNNTRTVIVVPDVIERPDSGTDTYIIHLYLYDTVGNMEAPDSAPTLILTNSAATNLTSRLGSTTGTLVGTGHYKWVYTNTSTDALEQLLYEFTVVEGGATRLFGRQSLIVDTTAVDFTAADRTKLNRLDTDYTTARAVKIDNLDATISSRSTYAGADTAGTTTLLSRLTSGRASNLDFLDVAISSRMATFSYTTPPTAAAIVTALWTDLLAGADFSTAGSIGKLLKDDIDAAISSRSTYAGADTAGTSTLLSRLTVGRAGNLDFLDVAVSSRLATTDKTGFKLAADGLDAIIVYTDSVSSRTLNLRQAVCCQIISLGPTTGIGSSPQGALGPAINVTGTPEWVVTVATGNRATSTFTPPA